MFRCSNLEVFTYFMALLLLLLLFTCSPAGGRRIVIFQCSNLEMFSFFAGAVVVVVLHMFLLRVAGEL